MCEGVCPCIPRLARNLFLERGKERAGATEKLVYTLGPEKELGVVREIYSMFLNQRLSID